jgi:predicted nucleic acid-binding Zn finger protein
LNIEQLSIRSWKVRNEKDEYLVWLNLNNIFFCTCPFSLRRYGRKCKHIKAVIKSLKRDFNGFESNEKEDRKTC